LLKTVTIKGNIHPPKQKLQFSSNMNGPGHADQVIMWDQLDACPDLEGCLVGKITGVTISNGHARSMRTFGSLNKGSMRIIIDGIMLDDKASLNDINTNEIYSIEVLRGGGFLAIYGSNAPGGALVITMKHGGEGTGYFSSQLSNGITTCRYTGFYKAKAFYTPKYTLPKKDSDTADLRSTIYWNPNIVTDKDGKATATFYNNDTKGAYRVVIEGIDDDGKLGRQVYRYQVQ